MILYDVLKLIDSGENTLSSICYKISIRYISLKSYINILKGFGFIEFRSASEDELRKDARSKWFIGLTNKGKLFIRDIEVFDEKYDGFLLGERIWISG